MPEPPRRSGRSRKVSARYDTDSWDDELSVLIDDDTAPPKSIPKKGRRSATATNSIVENEAIQDETPAPALHNDLTFKPIMDRSKGVEAANLSDENDNESGDALEKSDPTDGLDQRRTRQLPESHSRGITMVERSRSSRQGLWQCLFGPDLEDLLPILSNRDGWLYPARDMTLPSRKTLSWVRQTGVAQVHLLQDTRNDITNDKIPFPILKQQVLKSISWEQCKQEHFLNNGARHEIILGPFSEQRSYPASFLDSVSVGQAWGKDPSNADDTYHSGWLLNLGEKPRCMAWAPRQCGDQYLAVACRSTPEQRNAVASTSSDKSPAFAPSPSYPSSIQIWRFKTTKATSSASSMDCKTLPRLTSLFACHYGDIQKLCWAPENEILEKDSPHDQLGILTLIASNGCAYLIHIPKPNEDTDIPECLEVTRPAIKLDPPDDSIFTSFTFASPTDLILSTSSGQICIYNLSQPPAPSTTWQPYFTHQLHHTYITALAILDEPNHSHFLASLSASGMTQLTDLRSPDQDTIANPRARLPTRNLVYNHASRSFLTTVDSSGNTEPRGFAQTNLVAHNIRHFYVTSTVSRFPEGNGTATALAGSRFHPFVLVGNTAGTVWVQNVARRMLPSGRKGTKNHETGAWIQKLVEHEWIPLSTTLPSSSSSSSPDPSTANQDIFHGPPTRPGKSRFHQGFIPEKLDLSRSVPADKRKSGSVAATTSDNVVNDNDGGDDDDDNDGDENGDSVDHVGKKGAPKSTISVIYEEEQSVSCVAWNESQYVDLNVEDNDGGNGSRIRKGKKRARDGDDDVEEDGGGSTQDEVGNRNMENTNDVSAWCAVAWASGIVMVMDLAHDMD